MEIKQYNGKHKADFYIQCKGLHSGRPIKQPIANCFSVFNSTETDFKLVYSIYTSGKFKNQIIGTCIPFIRISDCRKIIYTFKDSIQENNALDFERIKQVDRQIENIEKRLKLMKEMKKALALRSLKKTI